MIISWGKYIINVASILLVIVGGFSSPVSYAQQIETFQYDDLGRICAGFYPDGSEIRYDYDANGNRTKVEITESQASSLTWPNCQSVTTGPGYVETSGVGGGGTPPPGSGGNTPPVAVDDFFSFESVFSGSQVILDVIGEVNAQGQSDTDADGDPLSLTSLTGSNASISGNLISYTVPASQGTYTLEYEVSDGQGGTDVATVTISVFSTPGPQP